MHLLDVSTGAVAGVVCSLLVCANAPMAGGAWSRSTQYARRNAAPGAARRDVAAADDLGARFVCPPATVCPADVTRPQRVARAFAGEFGAFSARTVRVLDVDRLGGRCRMCGCLDESARH